MILQKIDDLKVFDQVYLLFDDLNFRQIVKNIKSNQSAAVLLLKSNIDINLIKHFKNSKSVKLFYFQWSDIDEYSARWKPEKKAQEILNKNFNKFENKNSIISKLIINIFSSKKINLIFKKQLVVELRNILLQIEVSKILMFNNIKIINFFNNSKFKFLSKYDLISQENLKKFNIIFIKEQLYHKIFSKLFYFILIIFYPFFFLVNIKKFKFIRSKKKIGVRVYKNGFGFDDKKINLNWIVEKLNISCDDILFVFENKINTSHIDHIKTKKFNYTFASIQKPCFEISITFFFRLLIFYIPLFFFSGLLFLIFGDRNVSKEIFKSLAYFLIWKNQLYCNNFKNYISYHDYGSSHICRNILLKKYNCKSLMFKHTHSENVFNYDKKNFYAYAEMINLFYDTEFHWSQCSIEMAKANQSLSKSFVVSGPIWSSKEFFKKKPKTDKKIISFFMSSYSGRNAISSIDGHTSFIKFIEIITKKYPNYNIYLKPKSFIKRYLESKKIAEIYEEIKKRDNFYIVENEIPSYDLISISDLVISQAFSSPTVEAISMNKKSFYLDLNNKYKSGYFCKFNNLVSHSIDEGLNNLSLWLDLKDSLLEERCKNISLDMGTNANKGSPIEIIKRNLN